MRTSHVAWRHGVAGLGFRLRSRCLKDDVELLLAMP